MITTISIDDGIIPEGYEPVAFRNPTSGDKLLSSDGRLIESNGLLHEPRLILRKSWQWPEWLDAEQLEWFDRKWYAVKGDRCWGITWDMTNHPEPPDRTSVYHNPLSRRYGWRDRIVRLLTRESRKQKEREPMDLKEVIARIELENDAMRSEGFKLRDEDVLVLAAARAFACERCLGTGFEWKDKFQCNVPCPDCREDREKARGK